MEDSLWQDMRPQSPGGSGFPGLQPPWLSLSCVCLCFRSTEPSVFPLSIFSPGTLYHPGVQSWTEVSGSVWLTPGFAFRSVNFWRLFLRMGCAAFWGLTSLSGVLAGQHLPLLPHIPLCIPASPTPSSQHPLCAPLFPITPAFLPWLACIVLPSLCPVGFCFFRARVSKFVFCKDPDRK